MVYKKRILKTPLERFEAKINKTDTCWLWTACVSSKGYGQFGYKGKVAFAHRVSYELFKEPIHEGLYILHKCAVRNCVNPDHLYSGTQFENMRDRSNDGNWKGPDHKGEKHPNSKLTDNQIRRIKELLASGMTQASIGEQFGCKQSYISLIKRGLRWKHVD